MVHDSNDPRRPTAADELAEKYFDERAALDPIAATFAGLTAHPDRMTDYSPAGHFARTELARRTLARLPELTPTDDVDVVTLAALSEQLEQVLDAHHVGLDLASLNNISSPVQSVREVFDVCPTATEADWEAIAGRLHAVPATLAGYRESLREAQARRWVPRRRQVQAAAEQAFDAAAPGGFFVGFAHGARLAGDRPLPASLAAHVWDGATAAAAAYAELGDWLDTEVWPRARTDDAVGPDLYTVAAQGHLGAKIDFTEAYAWGLEELHAVERRMAELARVIAPEAHGTPAEMISAAVAALDADPRRTIEGADAFRDWMQRLADEAVRVLDGTHFDIPEPLRTLSCRLAPSSAGGVYYTSPSEDFSRPGQMWWSVPPGTVSFSTWRETSTIYHEGVPGHHLQLGQAMYRQDSLNRWRRMGSWVTGHGEGWALYAERLMAELGFLQDPGDLLGMLDAHALRACRVVVDLGVHLRLPAPDEVGGGLWDADKAWAFLTDHTRMPAAGLRFELDRYLGWPGQAISYKIGERVWLGLRAALAARMGGAFDLRAFHRRALDLGSVGLDVLAMAMLAM